MESRVRILETEVAVLGQRQTTSEAAIAEASEKVDTIHSRITNIDRRLSKMQGQIMIVLGSLQVVVAILFR